MAAAFQNFKILEMALLFTLADHRARVIWRHFTGAFQARIIGLQFGAHIVVLAIKIALARFKRFFFRHFLGC